MKELRELICVHINTSTKNSQYKDDLSFPIPLKTIKRIQAVLHFDTTGYTCTIPAHSVRHVKRGHPEDIQYICEIPHILEKFHRVEKSLTRDQKTGATLISLVFYKEFDKKMIKLVKLKINKDKNLELKTLFVKEQ